MPHGTRKPNLSRRSRGKRQVVKNKKFAVAQRRNKAATAKRRSRSPGPPSPHIRTRVPQRDRQKRLDSLRGKRAIRKQRGIDKFGRRYGTVGPRGVTPLNKREI